MALITIKHTLAVNGSYGNKIKKAMERGTKIIKEENLFYNEL